MCPGMPHDSKKFEKNNKIADENSKERNAESYKSNQLISVNVVTKRMSYVIFFVKNYSIFTFLEFKR